MKLICIAPWIAAAIAVTTLLTVNGAPGTAVAAPAPPRIPSGSLRITGTIWYLPPGFIYRAGNALVTTRRVEDGRTITARSDHSGNYSMMLLGGTWSISATGVYGRNQTYVGTCGSRALVDGFRPGTAAGFNINMRPR